MHGDNKVALLNFYTRRLLRGHNVRHKLCTIDKIIILVANTHILSSHPTFPSATIMLGLYAHKCYYYSGVISPIDVGLYNQSLDILH